MNSKNVTVNITNRTIVRTIVWVVVTILLFKFVGQITHSLILVFASFFFALALNPVVTWMSNKLRLKSRVRATAAAYLMVVAILILFFALVTPPLIRQTRTFINNVPQIVESYEHGNSSLAKQARKYKIDEKISDSARQFADHYSNYGSTVLDTGRRVIEVVVSIIVVIIMTFMMLVEGPAWLDRIFALMPAKKRQHNRNLAHRMYRGVTGFVNGQLILAILAGTVAFFALEIASQITHISVNAIALAGIVFFFGLIPLFGNLISTTVVVLACLSSSAELGLIMLIYFMIYYFVESHTLQPYVQSRVNELTPLTVFIAAIVGVGFAGFLGAIIAIPAATCIKVLVEDQIEKRGLKNA